MKKITKIIPILLVLILTLSLTACSSINKIKKELTALGYKEIQQYDKADIMLEECDIPVTVHLMNNADSTLNTEVAKFNVVIIFEFNVTTDMLEFYNESKTMRGMISDITASENAQEFYNTLVKEGYAKGNCLILSVNPIGGYYVKQAIKKA